MSRRQRQLRQDFAARDIIDGSFLCDYVRIFYYCYEGLRINPGSIVKLNVQPVEEGIEDKRPHFKRLYICYVALKESFKLCGYVIGLDGWFFKGLCGEQILAAIGSDPNDQMFPITFVIVEGGNKG